MQWPLWFILRQVLSRWRIIALSIIDSRCGIFQTSYEASHCSRTNSIKCDKRPALSKITVNLPATPKRFGKAQHLLLGSSIIYVQLPI